MWLLDAAGNQLRRETLFPSTLLCYWSFFKPIPEPFGHNPVPSALGWHYWGRNVEPNVLLWSLPTCPILRFCDSALQNWDLTPPQPGHRQGAAQGCFWGFWSSTEVQEKLKPMVNFEEVNWGTDGGFRQQAMVVAQYYSFYKENYIFNMVLWLKIPVWLWFLKLNAGFWIPVWAWFSESERFLPAGTC